MWGNPGLGEGTGFSGGIALKDVLRQQPTMGGSHC